MLRDNRSFLIRGDDGQEYGPADLGELRGWVQENRVGLGTDVRVDAPGAAWHPWHDFPELVALLAEVQGTDPLPGPPGLVSPPIRRRMVAWILDLLLLWILFIPIMAVAELFLPMDAINQVAFNPAALQNLPEETLHQILLFQFFCYALFALYLTGFIAARGQTPGKALIRLRVVTETGEKPSILNAFLRALVLILSLMFVFPLLFPFFNPQRRALHDIIAGTYVVEAS
jgi:uncharacterized RDD family membrane protein YckC